MRGVRDGGSRRALPRVAVRQANLREHNLGLVLDLIVRAPRPPSRAEIATATGLTRATVSVLVDRLIAGHLVTELDPLPAQRAGRPAVPLVPTAGTVAGVGLEVNVDYLAVRVQDLTATQLAGRIETGDFRRSDPATVLHRLAELFAAVVQDRPVAAVCVAVPGLVDRVGGVLRLAPNLGWRDVDVAAVLTSHPALQAVAVRIDNEATLGARAEVEVRRDGGSFIYVSGEVGIGGALVQDGAVHSGRHGWSGEIGHTAVDPDGPPCACGSSGCLEQYAGKDALFAAAGLDQDLPVTALIEQVDGGDGRARAAVDTAARALGIALANAINLVDVDTVVLGGIYRPLAPLLTPGISAQLRRRVLSAPWRQVTLDPASAQEPAALHGASWAALSTVLDDPDGWLGLLPTD